MVRKIQFGVVFVGVAAALAMVPTLLGIHTMPNGVALILGVGVGAALVAADSILRRDD